MSGGSEKFQPEKIILFGSYSDRESTQDSDIDLLVIMSLEGHPVEKTIEIRHAIDYHFALDLLVRSPKRLQQRLEMGDFLFEKICKKGAFFMKEVTQE